MIGYLVAAAILLAFVLGWVACHLAYRHELRQRSQQDFFDFVWRKSEDQLRNRRPW